MQLLIRAIVMGFGLAAGGALYKRVSAELGWDGEGKKKQDGEGGGDKAAGAADEGDLPGHPVDHARKTSAA